jgi:hypothetical protein
MSTLTAPRVLATRKMIGTVPHLPDPVAVVNQCLAEEEVARLNRTIRIERIIRAACHVLCITENEVFGTGRHPRVVLAREIITALARERTMLSYPQIARAMCRPNHSTVITAFQRFNRTINAEYVCGPVVHTKEMWLSRVREEALRA